MGVDNEKEKLSHQFPGRRDIASAATEAVEVTVEAAAGVVSKGFEVLTGIPGMKKAKEDPDDPLPPKQSKTTTTENAKGGTRHTDSTITDPKKNTLMTSGTAFPPETFVAPLKLERVKSDPALGASLTHAKQQTCISNDEIENLSTNHDDQDNEDDDDDSSSNIIVFHKDKDLKFKWAVFYWRQSFGLPEKGNMKLRGNTLIFKGIIGTRLSFDLEGIEVEKASRMGGIVNDAFRIRVKSTNVNNTMPSTGQEVEKQNGGEKYLFTTILKHRKEVIETIQSTIATLKLNEEANTFDANSRRGCTPSSAEDKVAKTKKQLFRMPPDPTLQKMNIIAKERIKRVSLQDYYEVAWSEGHNCDKMPMYGPFLSSCGKNTVQVNPWETGQEYKGEWCGETYTQQRFVTFNFMKQTIGQTLVEVKHTQRCRRVGNDQCIVHMTLEMKGFPYADCFVVEVRHVASRVGEHDLQVEVGMFVKFLKSCLFESKIRSNTGSETTKAQVDLLGRIVDSCKTYSKEVVGDEGEEEEDDETLEDALASSKFTEVSCTPIQLPEPIFNALRIIMMFFATLFRAYVQPYIQPELLNPFPPSSVDEALHGVRARVRLLEDISLKSVSERRKMDIVKEMKVIEKSLGRIERISKTTNTQLNESK